MRGVMPGEMRARIVSQARRVRSRRAVARRATPGIPAGLPPEVLEAACVDETGRQPRSVRHVHRSPFKAEGGSYLVLVDLGRGRRWTCFFKDARYERLLPLLDGLPAVPGRPELAVYTTADPTVKAHVPKAYWSDEDVSSARYRFLLEDASARRHKPSGAPEFARVAAELPSLSAALAQGLDRSWLIAYDHDFYVALAAYAERQLSALGRSHPELAALASLLERWPDVARYLADRALIDAVPHRPVHGDLNTASVLIGRSRDVPTVYLDWEWAGIGPPHLDLAILLEGADQETERAALEAYARADDSSSTDHTRALKWARVATCVCNAAILAAEDLGGHPRPRRDRVAAVEHFSALAMDALAGS